MMKKVLCILLLSMSTAGFSQQGDGGKPRGGKLQVTSKNIDHRVFNQPNIDALRAEDMVNDDAGVGPWRFGFNNNTNLNMNNSGTWFELPSGDVVWLLRLTCTGALTVNLTLDNVLIPEGNELYVYNPEKDFILGNFTSRHLYESTLGTELVPGASVYVEYYIPQQNLELPFGLNINRVTHGYRTASEFHEKAFGSSGSCNMNVNCPDGVGWVNERNSAVMLVSGGNGFCSGALINNTLNDGKPYVLTANHCYSNPASWVFRFNWQASACSNPASSPTFQSLSGAVLKSRRTQSDFCLVEITGGLINNTVPAAYLPFFAGWDKSGANPTSTVSIHHPSGDIKKISFDDAQAAPATAMGSEANGVWQVEWDRNTTTEGGSSGSPLFDQNHRIIGQLWGGGASCSNLSAPDYYGRVSNSWNPTSSNNTNHLKSWLDPNNSGVNFIDGYDPSGQSTITTDAGLTNPLGVSGTLCSASVTPQVTISNSGTDALTSATIQYGYDGATNLSYNWSGNLAQYQSTTVTLPLANLTGGNHTFSANVINPNGATDQNLANNTVNSSFTTVVAGLTLDFNLDLDCWGSETSWELTNASNQVLFSGSGYTDDNPTTINQQFCVDYGCYTFTIDDSWGDGLAGLDCNNASQLGAGSYQLTYNGVIKAQITTAQANFGFSNTQNFCLVDDASVEQINELSNWNIYPNPSAGNIQITTDGWDIEQLSILNMAGQELLFAYPNADSFSTSTKHFASGVYLVRIQTAKGTGLKRLIVN
jgi:lysyl endopeptidase